MSTHNQNQEKLTDRQKCLLVELVRTTDIQAAAKTASVARSTVYRWLQDPVFAEELTRKRNQTMNEALESVKTLTGRAARELGALLDTEDERLRRQICRDILAHSVKVRELEQIEQRLTRLEDKVKNQTQGVRQ